MAGHSKWANIQHRKGAQDKKRAKIFAKLGREITVAAKLGGGDPAMNPRLRLAVATAKSSSVPKDVIERAIQKGSGNLESDNYEEIRYEGFGPGGVAIIIEALSDNRNRTASEVRACFTKMEGSLGTTGSVNFMFDRIGEILYPLAKADADAVFEAALECGASNVESGEDFHEIHCSVEDFGIVREGLVTKFGEPEKSGLIWKPNILVAVDEETAKANLKLIDLLEDNDDVQNVTTNFEASDAVMEKLMATG